MSLVARFQKISLRWQICLLAAIAILCSLAVMGVLAFNQSRELVKEMTLERMRAQTNVVASRLEEAIDQTRADTLNIPSFPPIPGMVRCWENEEKPGEDPIQKGSTTKLWIERLGQIVASQMRSYPDRVRCAVYNRDGEGVMTVESLRGSPILVTDNLPPIRTASHFLAASELRDDQVHVSPMIPGQDGNISIHLCTPFFGDPSSARPDEFKGVFVITLDGKRLLEEAVNIDGADAGSDQQNDDLLIDVGDETMQFLYSNDPQIEDLFGGEGFDALRPVRADLLEQKIDGEYDTNNDTYSEFIEGSLRPDKRSMIATYRRIFYGAPEDDDRFWFVACSEYGETALSRVNDLAKQYALIGAAISFASLLFMFFIASGLTSSLSKLTRSADEIAGGKLDTEIPATLGVGEVGQLESSFRSMTDNLQSMIRVASDQQARTKSIFNATADGLITIDEQGVITSFNNSAERLFGYQADEVVGQNISMLAPSPHREQHDGYLARYLQTGEARIIGRERLLEGSRKDGTLFPISLRVSELKRNDERVFIGLIQDITPRKQAEEERNQIFSAIRDGVHRLATATQQILATTSQQSAGTQQQAAAVSEVVATADEIAQTASQAALRADEMAQSARHTGEVGSGGLRAIEDSVAAMNKVKVEVESIADRMMSLADRARQIKEITATVSEIAEQTNVLALNASVEASRAGEHGKGFAVVATEVKSLAQDSKEATEQVRSILKEITEATDLAVLSTEQGTRTVGEAKEVISEARDTIHALAGTLEQSVQTASQISATASQQAAAVGQLNQGIRNIDTVTKESVEAIRQIENAAQNLTDLSNELAALTER